MVNDVNIKALIIFLVLVGCLNAQSEPPSPTPSKQGQFTQNDASKEKQASDLKGSALPATILQPSSPSKNTDTQNEEKNASRPWWKDPNWVIVIFTGVLAAAAIFQVQVYKSQSRIMREGLAETKRAADAAEKAAEATRASVEIMDKTAAKQLRAYLYAGLATAEVQDPIKQTTFSAKIALTNAGQTPAKKLRVKALADIFQNPLPAGHDFKTPYGIGDTYELGPKQVTYIPAVVPRVQIAGEITNIKNSNGKALYLWGTAEYEDVFGEPHVTNFGVMITWNLKDSAFTTTFLPGRNDST